MLVNLASDEDARAVDFDAFGRPAISPRFEDTNTRGTRSVVSFFAKRARGEMASWVVTNRVRSLRKLRDFDESGYRYDVEHSTHRTPVYLRSAAT